MIIEFEFGKWAASLRLSVATIARTVGKALLAAILFFLIFAVFGLYGMHSFDAGREYERQRIQSWEPHPRAPDDNHDPLIQDTYDE